MQKWLTRDRECAGYRGELNTRAQCVPFWWWSGAGETLCPAWGGLSPFKLQGWQAVAIWNVYEKKSKQVSQPLSLVVTHCICQVNSLSPAITQEKTVMLRTLLLTLPFLLLCKMLYHIKCALLQSTSWLQEYSWRTFLFADGAPLFY